MYTHTQTHLCKHAKTNEQKLNMWLKKQQMSEKCCDMIKALTPVVRMTGSIQTSADEGRQYNRVSKSQKYGILL